MIKSLDSLEVALELRNNYNLDGEPSLQYTTELNRSDSDRRHRWSTTPLTICTRQTQ